MFWLTNYIKFPNFYIRYHFNIIISIYFFKRMLIYVSYNWPKSWSVMLGPMTILFVFEKNSSWFYSWLADITASSWPSLPWFGTACTLSSLPVPLHCHTTRPAFSSTNSLPSFSYKEWCFNCTLLCGGIDKSKDLLQSKKT